MALEVVQEFLRLVLGHEADELRQVLVLRERLLADEAVLGPQFVDAGFLGNASGDDLMTSGIDVVQSPASASHLLMLEVFEKLVPVTVSPSIEAVSK